MASLERPEPRLQHLIAARLTTWAEIQIGNFCIARELPLAGSAAELSAMARTTSTWTAVCLALLCDSTIALHAPRPSLLRGVQGGIAPRPARSAAVVMQTEPRAEETNAEASDGSGGIRQLLGLKGAKEATGEEFLNWKIRLQLTKPATWIPLIWGVACGAAASGSYHAIWNLFGDAPTTDSWGEVGVDTIKALSAMVLAGPFMCGFTQTINDWYDRDLDAINEPYRPIPSGKIKGWEIATQVAFLLGGGGLLAWNLDGWAGNDWPVITFVAALGTLLAYIYSAPPLKLKVSAKQRTRNPPTPWHPILTPPAL